MSKANLSITPIQDFLALSPDVMIWRFMAGFGWLIFAIIFLWAAKILWLKYVKGKWGKNIKYILLAIDIPRGNIQSPQAVENLFTYFGGAHSTQNFYDKWFAGEYQLSFSFEIVSLEGYTQFLIRTPAQFKPLVESAVYSQYPDAEIVEVDDYCEEFPKNFPDEEYDIWGSEFIQSAHYMYPIKTYKEFEHRLGPDETTFRDPMAELMELCSSLRRGENLLYQIIVIPTGFDWVDDGKSEIDKILGKKTKESLANRIVDRIMEWVSFLSEQVYTLWSDIDEDRKDPKSEKLSMMELTPKQKKKIEAIENKSAKLGFLCKVRMVYLSKKEVMNRAKVVNGFIGYIKQFSALDLNSFKPDLKRTATKTAYFNKTGRLIAKKNRILRNYVSRSDWAGCTAFLLNIEELATIWHFPVEATANAPLIQKTAAKRYKPPANLAVDDAVSDAELLKEELLQEDFSRAKRGFKKNDFYNKEAGEVDLKNKNYFKDSEIVKDKFNESFDNNSGYEPDSTDDIFIDKGNSSSASNKKSPPSNLPFG